MADVEMAFGSLYWSSAASTTLSAATPAKAAGTTAGMQNNNFTASTSNRLTYTGTTTLYFKVECTATMQTSGTAGCVGSLWLYKNAAAITGAEIQRSIATTADKGAAAVTAVVQLATNDYVELWVETDDGDDMQIDFGVLSAVTVG